MENSDSLMESNKWEEEEEDDGEDSDEGEEQDGDNQRLTNSSAERDKLRKGERYLRMMSLMGNSL